MKDNFVSRGYSSKSETTIPLKKEKKIHPSYTSLVGYKYSLTKESEFGTSIELTWKPEKLNTLIIKFIEDPPRQEHLVLLMSFLMITVFYGLTVYFYEYWLLTFATLFICFLLTFLMVILPAIVGMAIGSLIGKGLYRLTVSDEIKEHNKKDKMFLHTEVMKYAHSLVANYRSRIYELSQEYHPPPPIA